MNIDRSNYETWFIDWLDGRLDESMIEILSSFLDNNPDLKEEFEGLSAININPTNNSFLYKDSLKRTAAEFTDEQVEYLSVAYFEKDISDENLIELKECLEKQPEKRDIFESFRNIRLKPFNLKYNKKKKLLKLTPATKIIRSSFAVISIAAAILLFIILSKPSQNIISPVQDNISTLASNTPSIENVTNVTISETKKAIPLNINKESHKSATDKTVSLKTIIDEPQPSSRESVIIPSDTLRRTGVAYDNVTLKVQMNRIIGFSTYQSACKLVAFNSTVPVTEENDNRNNFELFITRIIRNKILNKDSVSSTPLKGYEIAEAGITGLNKLLGWDMTLSEKNNERGEPESIYFNSRLLKFNTPVNKNENYK